MQHQRSLATLATAPFTPHHYNTVANALRRAGNPTDLMARYILRGGSYPHVVRMKAFNGKKVGLTIYSAEDIITIVEIFCRKDYPVSFMDKIVVDFGSNIGISAVWYLSEAPESFVYLFEPVPTNVSRLEANLAAFSGRFELNPLAVGPTAGPVSFGVEQSGRYGGVGRETGETIEVECVDSNEVLSRVLETHGSIDILKIDIETLEKQVTERIPPEIAARINKIYVEYIFDTNPLAKTHRMKRIGPLMTHFIRKESDGIRPSLAGATSAARH
jgi:FkbM family methyltransferase